MSDDTIYPPLTTQEFAEGAGYEYRGVPLVEDEDARYVYAWGHVDKTTYAGAVNDYDTEMQGYEPDALYSAEDVQHVWAVTLTPPANDDGWYVSWADKHQEHPLRFPMTVVHR